MPIEKGEAELQDVPQAGSSVFIPSHRGMYELVWKAVDVEKIETVEATSKDTKASCCNDDKQMIQRLMLCVFCFAQCGKSW